MRQPRRLEFFAKALMIDPLSSQFCVTLYSQRTHTHTPNLLGNTLVFYFNKSCTIRLGNKHTNSTEISSRRNAVFCGKSSVACRENDCSMKCSFSDESTLRAIVPERSGKLLAPSTKQVEQVMNRPRAVATITRARRVT